MVSKTDLDLQIGGVNDDVNAASTNWSETFRQHPDRAAAAVAWDPSIGRGDDPCGIGDPQHDLAEWQAFSETPEGRRAAAKTRVLVARETALNTLIASIEAAGGQIGPVGREAMRIAQAGYRVFPLQGNTKIPATENGFHAGTTDPAKVAEWWVNNENLDIGIRTDGVVVIDVDRLPDTEGNPKVMANPWLADEPMKLAELHAAPTAETASGGRHHWFNRPLGVAWHKMIGEIAPGIDVLTGPKGPISVAVPHGQKGRVQWINCDRLPIPDDLPELPAWLRDMIAAVEAKKVEKSPKPQPTDHDDRDDYKEAVKAAAADHGWADVLTNVAGIAPKYLTGANVPCPKCGGKDRFRFVDWDGEGGVFCNQCFADKDNGNGGDGLASVKWATGKTFTQTVNAVGEYLGIERPTTVAGRDAVLSLETPEGLSDRGNAARFAEAYGNRCRYCFQRRKWLVWDDRRWAWDTDGSVGRFASDAIDELWSGARSLGDRGKEARAWAASSGSKKRIDAMLGLAQSLLPIRVDELDRDRYLLCCKNGTLDLRTGEIRPHDPTDYITAYCPTEYHAGASDPMWDQFLAEVFCGKSELIGWVQRYIGHCLTGSVQEDVFTIFHGGGGNGKTTLINAVMHTLGGDYAGSIAPDLLLAQRGDSHPTGLADLCGKRLAVAMETRKGRKLDEATIKRLTGGDARIKARGMREDYWEFDPTHKMILVTNPKPTIEDCDEAIRRRLRLVPFDAKFASKPNKRLRSNLLKAAPAILAWAVRGCLEWHDAGELGDCPEVATATKSYVKSQDVIGQFIEECCVIAPGVEVRAAAFFTALCAWLPESGYEGTWPSQASVGAEMRQRYPTRRSNGTFYEGVALQADDPPDSGGRNIDLPKIE